MESLVFPIRLPLNCLFTVQFVGRVVSGGSLDEMSDRQDNLGKVVSLKTVRMTASKLSAGLGVQDTPNYMLNNLRVCQSVSSQRRTTHRLLTKHHLRIIQD